MKNVGKKTIIVAYASTGSGHTVAAKTIAEDLRKSYPNIDVYLADILDSFKNSRSGDQFVSATSGVLAPIFDKTWRMNFTGRVLWGGGYMWPSFLYKDFENLIKEIKPSAVVCTHCVCANAAAKARLALDDYFPIISVPTDYETEGLWPHRETDLFCVASQEMKNTLIARRVSAEKIHVTGLPVSSDFTIKYSKTAARQKLGLPKDKKIALVIAGANASGPYKNIRKTLNGAIEYFAKMDWMHFVICLGFDTDYADKIDALSYKHKAQNISIVSFTENLAELMAASDIALIKPGGLAVTECAAAKLPVILVGKTYAQENINRRFLVAYGAAEHTVSSKGVASLLQGIFTNKNRYKALKTNISKVAKPDTAHKIAQVAMVASEVIQVPEKKHLSSIYIGKTPVHTR